MKTSLKRGLTLFLSLILVLSSAVTVAAAPSVKAISERETAPFEVDAVSAVLMDVRTGEILALAVYPSYDLNDPHELAAYYKQKLLSSGLEKGSEAYSALAGQYLLESWSKDRKSVV